MKNLSITKAVRHLEVNMLLDRARTQYLRMSTAIKALLRGETVAERLWDCVCEAWAASRERQFWLIPDPLAVVRSG